MYVRVERGLFAVKKARDYVFDRNSRIGEIDSLCGSSSSKSIILPLYISIYYACRAILGYSNNVFSTRGVIPSYLAYPDIVYVFPLPVCPNAIIHEFIPYYTQLKIPLIIRVYTYL